MLMLCFRDGREAWSQAGAEDCKGANPETTNPNRQQITPVHSLCWVNMWHDIKVISDSCRYLIVVDIW